MKRILALTLALMLALSLTAALADSTANDNNKSDEISLMANVAEFTDAPTYPPENDDSQKNVWNISFNITTPTWNINRMVTQKKSRTWNTSTHTYDEGDLGFGSRLIASETDVLFKFTNNCNFNYDFTTSLHFENAFRYEDGGVIVIAGNQDGNDIAPGTTSTLTLRLLLERLPEDISAGSNIKFGTLGITYTPKDRVQPQPSEQPDDEPVDPDPEPDLGD